MQPDTSVFRGRLAPLLLIGPSILLLLVFLYYPAIRTLMLSAYQSNVVLGTQKFVGLQNFLKVLSDPTYLQAFWQTALFAALVVVLGIFLSLMLSLMASNIPSGGRFYRLMLIFPYALSPAIAGTLWLFLFNPEIGTVNSVLFNLFGIKPRWLDDPNLAFILVVAAAVWKNLGYNIAFYLAAVQNLPKEVVEAARIDGVNSFQMFWKITVPMLSPITFFLVFANLIYALFDSFGLVDILTRGGPVNGETGVTTFLIYKLYREGFENFQTGMAATQAILMLVIVGVLTLIQFRVGRKQVHYGG
ncbi:carbohydrate ABC transporter permease [Deinococcus cellulosilyticus]|uniref:sn-glycerol-3-phosphate transport system permease protein UgpA n=1 Tax=Deinococcus cellulosilyticus (strain DSM 18568 / NBRC 106333 / KACC 11606 / 5516J-15) TaxID=1223518 RepID=A0A511N638_DEIC1|nr:sugar ABC transporter permease [Deinococcus cellulosilyticus]GEM48329.1 sn-glycerol-3-phosphate transport system permease protein UgpA [Deinococcus cellulosilyticus NBRC 106333 = KACC 11606]